MKVESKAEISRSFLNDFQLAFNDNLSIVIDSFHDVIVIRYGFNLWRHSFGSVIP